MEYMSRYYLLTGICLTSIGSYTYLYIVRYLGIYVAGRAATVPKLR